MKKNIVCMALLTALFAGCQQEDLNGEYGYLQLSSVRVDKNVQTKAGDVLSLDIYDAGGVLLKHADDWTAMQAESLLLPVGTYTLKAYSATGSAEAQGFEAAPYYAGQTDVPVEKGVAKTATVTCGLAQAKVQVSYSDRFKQVFSTYSTALKNSKGSLEFVQTETRQALVCAGEALEATLSMAKTDGVTKTHKHQVAAEIQPKCLYKVNYDINQLPGSMDFSITVNIQVDRYDINTTVPLESDVCVDLKAKSADAWGQFAYLHGTSKLVSATDPYTFQYKQVSASEWTSVDAQLEGGEYKAKTGKLEFNTAYNYRLVCGSKLSASGTFTTEPYQEVPNLDFEAWKQNGKNWYPNPVANNFDDPQAFWATGNEGVTIFKDANTFPVEGAEARTGKAAKMITRGNILIAKAAAGNLFIGKFKTNTNDPVKSVTFGRPYTGARPVSFSGYYKYEGKKITSGDKPGTLSKDEGHIYMRLWNGEKEIGYGELVIKEDATAYTPFTIDIKYSDTTLKPTSMTIVTTSSHYGGEFSGMAVVGQVGDGSTLWVDDFSISYYKE